MRNTFKTSLSKLKNEKLQQRIVRLLEKEVTEGEEGAMAIRMVQGTDEEAAIPASWIKAMLMGIMD